MTRMAVQKVQPARRPRAEAPQPLWYKNAVIYELHVRSFCDSAGDGVGDFRGLISRLDYLQDLGITAVWLLPFYPSPLRDDGYDIADYSGVNPAYGDREDVRRFIHEAHRRGLRVITELVINHTSDQHPWFQRARRAPRGSPERDFYVWTDTPDRYAGTRIIFKDFETSNWSWDPAAKQYFWHRFYSHQPDLNFDNPKVHAAVMEVCDDWFRLGVDGMRLDAVPYLFEREGTSCENLPETHEFLRKLRAHVDRRFPNRMLLAEANQWPEDAIAYLGRGDECHMAFHFPLMPRMFMALRMEDRYPILDILEQTPAIPDNCQWALFLRNHDELTLEMVTDEERDYMYRVYASDREMRINLGIRRRLAPLLNNNRRKVELMNALLFSLPGTPVIYYGDEIGMGDNIYLGDRDGVRTPMQWSADRNSGFSRANPQRLYLPLIIDPEYHYETVNVESQQANPSSLLWWMKRLIALRKRHPVFGHGEIRFLTPANHKVLAFIRRSEAETVLVVANLSRFVQPMALDLAEYRGCTPVEMFGRVPFPTIEDRPYFLSLGPHNFYWFLLEPPVATQRMSDAEIRTPEYMVHDAAATSLPSAEVRRSLDAALPAFLRQRRWFVSKARHVQAARIRDEVLVRTPDRASGERAYALVRVDFTEGEPEHYALPLGLSPAGDESRIPPEFVIARLTDGGGERRLLHDATCDPEFARALLTLALRGRELESNGTRLFGRRIGRKKFSAAEAAAWPVHLPRLEQSNSTVIFGDRLLLKLYRKVEDGPNPEMEVGEHLTARVQFPHTAPMLAALESVPRTGAPQTVAAVFEFVPNEGDAWTWFLECTGQYYEAVAAMPGSVWGPGVPSRDAIPEEPPAAFAPLTLELLEAARMIGVRTAEMHAALADDRGNPDFAPEPSTLLYQRSIFQSMRNTTRATLKTLDRAASGLSPALRSLAEQVRGREADILAVFQELMRGPIVSPRIRCHGDYHLGQILRTGRDYIVIDFEGEPLRSIGQRRLKRSPLRDVAGMLRSFDYLAWTGLRRHDELLPADRSAEVAAHLEAAAQALHRWLTTAYRRAYLGRMGELKTALLPEEPATLRMVLRVWQLEKALYEVGYELNSRPDWVEVPLRALLDLLRSDPAPHTEEVRP